ncbi:DUF7510 family protein [Halorhabdus amylolytica]|uniref:DUF7510 family protein n=1 Tax=Halorhabdus amylolytica TaxID=2559573 RepID=UPI0010AAB441|nr:hypothetical protein [Halorhabdus amylolytica]
MTSPLAGENDDTVSVTVEIEDGRTVVVVDGTQDAAVVVESASGERVYLPPEAARSDIDLRSTEHDDSPYEGIPNDSPYEGIQDDSPYEGIPNDSPYEGVPNDSPYKGIQDDSPYEGIQDDSPYEGIRDDSPYESGPTPETSSGVVPIENGFRVVHPEPASDVRFLR